jgi:hypothetical protein
VDEASGLELASRCPNCGAGAAGAWCAGCGQELATGRGSVRRTIRRQWERIRHSLWTLVARPGQLTAEFRDGQRARSIAPWRLAFNMIAAFFLLTFVTDFRVANFPKQDPSGTIASAISAGAKEANVDEATFTERLDRRFNTLYLLWVGVLVAARAAVARLTHLRHDSPWSVHFVFALHLTAWTVVANVVYYVALRLFGLSPTANDAFTQTASVVLLVAIELWQLSYVLVAFRRVYADRWVMGGVKAAVMVVTGLVVGNAMVLLSLWLALKTVSHGG